MSEYTPEPWEYFEEIHKAGKLRIYCSVARKAGGKSPEDNILRISGEGGEHTVRSIVACVNACAGMADPAAEIAKLRAKREALHKAAAELLHALSNLDDPSKYGVTINQDLQMRSRVDIARTKLGAALAEKGE